MDSQVPPDRLEETEGTDPWVPLDRRGRRGVMDPMDEMAPRVRLGATAYPDSQVHRGNRVNRARRVRQGRRGLPVRPAPEVSQEHLVSPDAPMGTSTPQ
jgi:hypothetical protein